MEKKSAVTITIDGFAEKITTDRGMLLSSVLTDHAVPLDMPCGGKGVCRKCSVEINGFPCLACQTKVEGDMNILLKTDFSSMSILPGLQTIPKSAYSLYKTWGVSVDIGTTTLCAALSGSDGSFETAIRKNPQTSMGADVISRIDRAVHGDLPELTAGIQTALREMIRELADKREIRTDIIDAAVITGNTAMLCLLTGRSPKSLAYSPFTADCLFGEDIPSDSLNLPLAKAASVTLPPCISAFLGADIVTAILASGMYDKHETALFADIGTNGEIVLIHNGIFYCASASAGPAFEGYGLSHGTYGVKGAVNKVWLEHDTCPASSRIKYSTIGNAPPIGICGSGLIDLLAAMRKLGLVKKTGYLDSPLKITGDIYITPEDIQNIQLAKGAIRAGIETLIEVSGVCKSGIQVFYIAGGFGSSLNPENAGGIGLIPPELVSKTVCIGNAAHTGAAMILQDGRLIEKASSFAKTAQVVPLESSTVFRENFMKYMMLE